VLERIAGIRSKTSENNIISWLESRGEETERVDKGKQREQSLGRTEEEGQVEGQEDENAMEGMEEGSSGCSLVIYSVGTRTK